MTMVAGDSTDVTTFTYGVLLARIPLFLFQAVQAALLPRLSRLAARNELDEFRSGFIPVVAAIKEFPMYNMPSGPNMRSPDQRGRRPALHETIVRPPRR